MTAGLSLRQSLRPLRLCGDWVINRRAAEDAETDAELNLDGEAFRFGCEPRRLAVGDQRLICA